MSPLDGTMYVTQLVICFAPVLYIIQPLKGGRLNMIRFQIRLSDSPNGADISGTLAQSFPLLIPLVRHLV